MHVAHLTPKKFSEPLPIELSGSKSYVNRCLIIGALTAHDVLVQNPSEAEDAKLLTAGLWQAGWTVSEDIQGYTIGQRDKTPEGLVRIDCGAAGTVSRFLLALLATTDGEWLLDGTERLCERPIGALVDALRQLGAEIHYTKNEGSLPLHVIGKTLEGGVVTLDGSKSSQFLSALLLAAPAFQSGIEVRMTGVLASESYAHMTQAIMHEAGVQISRPMNSLWKVKPQKYRAKSLVCEIDMTGAGYFWALGALSGVPISVSHVPLQTEQADIMLPLVLEQFGAEMNQNAFEKRITISRGKNQPLVSAGELDLRNMPDSALTVAVVAAMAKGTTRLVGLGTLRDKECDRVLALATELQKCNVETTIGEDWIEIIGNPAGIFGAQIKTYDDHRIAMAFGILGCIVDGMSIIDPTCTKKSIPSFWNRLTELGITIDFE